MVVVEAEGEFRRGWLKALCFQAYVKRKRPEFGAGHS